MLFHGHYLAGLLGAVNDDLLVQRLDGTDIYNLCTDAFLFQHLCCTQSGIYADTSGYDGYILTFTDYGSLTDLEMITRMIIDHGYCSTSETNIYRSFIFQSGTNSGSCFHIIGRAHYYHAGNGTHQSNILVTLVGSAVLTYGDTCMGRTDLDIQMRVTDRVTYLFKSTSCCEHCKRAYEGNLTYQRQSCSHTHHVGLCDTAVDVAVGICLTEDSGLGSCCQVGIQYYQIGEFFCQLLQGVAVTFSGCDLFHGIFCHYCSPAFSNSFSILSRSAIAIAYSSSLGALPCQSTLFSMKETPLPLMLWNTIQVGMPLVSLASLNAARIASKSCASALITWKLNASNFLSIG